MIEAEGEGVLLYLAQEGRGIGLLNKLRAYKLQEEGLDTVEANERLGLPADLRDFGIGAQILVDLGLSSIRILTNNPKKIHALEGYGLSVTDQIPIEEPPNPENLAYLRDQARQARPHAAPSGPRPRRRDAAAASARRTQGAGRGLMARYALVVARFYEELAARLEAGARGVLEASRRGRSRRSPSRAPSSSAGRAYAAQSGRFAGVICLGAVIRGETDHYEHVCAAAAYGIPRWRCGPAFRSASGCSPSTPRAGAGALRRRQARQRRRRRAGRARARRVRAQLELS